MAEATPQTLLDMAITRSSGGRNNAGLWLAQQLRDNKYTEADAEAIMLQLVANLGSGYTAREAQASLKSAYRRPARDPWTDAGSGDNWKTKRVRAPVTAPPPRLEPEPDPETVARFETQKRGIRPLPNSPAEAYLNTRGITSEMANAARVKFSASWGVCGPAAVFGIRNEKGVTIAAAGRAISADILPENNKRTYGPKALGVFATPGALDADPVAITEAPIDALSLAMAGMPTIAICGTGGIPQWLITRLAKSITPGRSRTVYMAFDADSAGDMAAPRIEAQFTLIQCKRLRPEGAKDWNGILTAQGVEYLRDWLKATCPAPNPIKYSITTPNAPESSPTQELPYSRIEPPQTIEELETVDIFAVDPRPAQAAALAELIIADLAGKPLPIRIGPGETISNLELYAMAEARDVVNGGRRSRPALDRLARLGIAIAPLD